MFSKGFPENICCVMTANQTIWKIREVCLVAYSMVVLASIYVAKATKLHLAGLDYKPLKLFLNVTYLAFSGVLRQFDCLKRSDTW